MTRTAIHPPTGEIVTPEGFVAREGARYRERGIWPRCPACGAKLFIHGVHSPNVTSRFRHAQGSACPLSTAPDPRFAHLVPEAWDPAAGEWLKSRFCEEEHLKQAYMVCHRLCGRRLTSDEFSALCRRANRLGLFRYRGLPLWVVPWLLVTLDAFSRKKRGTVVGEENQGDSDEGMVEEFQFRFVLNKPARAGIEVVWNDPSRCSLEKVFVNSGKRMRNGLIPLGDPGIEMARKDTAWINRNLLCGLQRCCQRLGCHG